MVEKCNLGILPICERTRSLPSSGPGPQEASELEPSGTHGPSTTLTAAPQNRRPSLGIQFHFGLSLRVSPGQFNKCSLRPGPVLGTLFLRQSKVEQSCSRPPHPLHFSFKMNGLSWGVFRLWLLEVLSDPGYGSE